MKLKQINKLSFILGLGGLNGSIALVTLTNFFKLENIFSIAVLFMAGPAAILTAVLLEGSFRERMFIALLSGIIATIIVVLSAGLGPILIEKLNIEVLKIFGGISIFMIGLMIMGIKISSSLPNLVMVVGILISFIWK